MAIKEIAARLDSTKSLDSIFNAYVMLQSNCEVRNYPRYVAGLAKDMETETLDLLHAAVGISGEAGELLDAVKKHWVYEQPLNRENVLVELGDLLFYVTAIMIVLQVDMSAVLQRNANKLDKRYPQGTYSNAAAKARADDATTANSASASIGTPTPE